MQVSRKLKSIITIIYAINSFILFVLNNLSNQICKMSYSLKIMYVCRSYIYDLSSYWKK